MRSKTPNIGLKGSEATFRFRFQSLQQLYKEWHNSPQTP